MTKRSVSALCLLAGCALGAQTVTINDVKLTVGDKLAPVEPIEITGLTFYSAKASTGEECVVVTGLVNSRLQAHPYTVRVNVQLWGSLQVTAPADMILEPSKTAEAVVTVTPEKRRARFTSFVLIEPARVKAYSVQYRFQNISAEPFAKPKE